MKHSIVTGSTLNGYNSNKPETNTVLFKLFNSKINYC